MVQNIDAGDVTADGSDNILVCNNTRHWPVFEDGVCIEDAVRNDDEDFARPTLVPCNKICDNVSEKRHVHLVSNIWLKKVFKMNKVRCFMKRYV